MIKLWHRLSWETVRDQGTSDGGESKSGEIVTWLLFSGSPDPGLSRVFAICRQRQEGYDKDTHAIDR